MDYKRDLSVALERGDFAAFQALAEQAFREESSNEDLLAFVAGSVYEKRVQPCFALLAQFVERFPRSIHPIRPYFAALLLDAGHIDAASNEARIYLRTVKDLGFFAQEGAIPSNLLLSEGVGRAFLQLTGAYTELGARQYSQRVLSYGKAFVSEYWKAIYDRELQLLAQELSKTEEQTINKEWEDFFQSGVNVEALLQRCEARSFESLRLRLSALETKFRYQQGYTVGEEEMFQLLVQDAKGEYGLA